MCTASQPAVGKLGWFDIYKGYYEIPDQNSLDEMQVTLYALSVLPQNSPPEEKTISLSVIGLNGWVEDKVV
jgi:hypothetical protein